MPGHYVARELVDAIHLVRPEPDPGWRVIPMVPWIYDALRAWLEVSRVNPWVLVWPTLEAGRSRHRSP